MKTIHEKIEALDWALMKHEMNEKGYAIIPNLITDEQCNEFIKNYDNPNG